MKFNAVKCENEFFFVLALAAVASGLTTINSLVSRCSVVEPQFYSFEISYCTRKPVPWFNLCLRNTRLVVAISLALALHDCV